MGRHAERYGLELDNDGACTVSAGLKRIVQRALRTDAVARHEGTALLLLGPSIRHFGMCVLKCFPKLTVLRLFSDTDVRVVVPTDVPENYLNLMHALGVLPGQIMFHDRKVFRSSPGFSCRQKRIPPARPATATRSRSSVAAWQTNSTYRHTVFQRPRRLDESTSRDGATCVGRLPRRKP